MNKFNFIVYHRIIPGLLIFNGMLWTVVEIMYHWCYFLNDFDGLLLFVNIQRALKYMPFIYITPEFVMIQWFGQIIELL